MLKIGKFEFSNTVKMRYPLILISAIAVFYFTACGKDKFTTEPQVKAKSVKPGVVFKGEIITFTSSFTDDEGDIQDTVIIVYKRFDGATVLTADTIHRNVLPNEIPKARQGEIIVQIAYGELIPFTLFINQESVDREVSFGIIIRDKDGHRSNYSESDRITLKKV